MDDGGDFGAEFRAEAGLREDVAHGPKAGAPGVGVETAVKGWLVPPVSKEGPGWKLLTPN